MSGMFCIIVIYYLSAETIWLYAATDILPGASDQGSIATVILLFCLFDLLLSFFNDALINYNIFFMFLLILDNMIPKRIETKSSSSKGTSEVARLHPLHYKLALQALS